ncbi:unnamed protein product [Rhizoctonia solani]|uniref:MICOS complex subunit MIC10 n=1 Tax=Rhizoctonia solani TaxID=456999 RepID=A0A8H2XTF6_9AGAM|nr:unnamed protein product [Rhizoctonia solani]
MSSAPSKNSSEDIIGQKYDRCVADLIVKSYYDRCVADLIVKSGVGFGVGIVASVLLFRRRGWPVALSTGFGAGAAYADCDRSFNPARIPGTRIVPPSALKEQK